MSIIINPGTEAREGHSEANAVNVAEELLSGFKEDYPNLELERNKQADDKDGWYGFRLVLGDRKLDVDIPGDDPENVMAGIPFKSRRLYVDGSSWLWGYALGSVSDWLGDAE